MFLEHHYVTRAGQYKDQYDIVSASEKPTYLTGKNKQAGKHTFL